MGTMERHASYRPLYQTLQPNTIRLLRIIPQAITGEPLYQLLEAPLPSTFSLRTQSEPAPIKTERMSQPCYEHGYAALVIAARDPNNESGDTVSIPVLSRGGGEHIIQVERDVRKALEQLVLEFSNTTSPAPAADASDSAELYVWTEDVCVDRASAEDVATQAELVEELVRHADKIVVWNGSKLERVAFE